jgi:radical SAM superfamily enzyme YgiQ (UPF0313 family)
MLWGVRLVSVTGEVLLPEVLFLKPPSEVAGQNVVRDFVYGCWCNGRRIGGMQMPPLNELYVTTHVRSAGIDAELLDAQATPGKYKSLLDSAFANVRAVVLMTSTQSFRHDVSVLRRIKDLNPRINSVLFGSHPTFMPEYCLQADEVDYVVRREPEETLKDLLCHMMEDRAHEELLGIAYKSGGRIVVNPDRPYMDMNDLPIPDRSLLPEGVDYFNPVVKRLPYTTMQTARGCPGRCVFCTAPSFYGKKYRYKSADNVVNELKEIAKLGYREVIIRDETFTTNKRRNREICERMIDEEIDLSWIANARTDLIDCEMMALMKKAGCHMVKFGVETGNDEILRNYKKGTTTAQAREVFKIAHDLRMETHAHVVLGGPGESRETIEKTIRFVKELDPTTASFGILTPYPGSPLFDMVAEKQPAIRDGSDSTMKNLHAEGFYSEAICGMSGEELSKLVVRSYRKFYWRPMYLLKRLLSIRSLEQFMILTVAGLNIFQFALTGKK